jgi:hypothetical protein
MLGLIAKHRVWCAVVALPAILLAWYLCIFGPQLRTEAELESERLSIREKISDIERRLGRAASITGEFRSIDSRWSRITEHLVTVDSAELILDHVRDIAETTRLSIAEIDLDFDPLLRKVGADGKKPYTDRVRVKMSGHGRFFDIGDFVDSLQNNAIVAAIDNVKLAYEASSDPEIHFGIAAEVFILSGEADLP